MTSDQITNRQLKQFIESYIRGKKNVYFLITTGSFYDQRLEPFHPKTDEYTGEEKFLQTLDIVFDENPYQMGVELYEKAKVNIKADPFYNKTFVLHKEKPTQKNDNGGLQGIGLEGFGGIEGIMDSKLSVKYLSGENKRLEKANQKLDSSNSELTKQVKVLNDNVNELKNEIQKKEWKINSLNEDHKRAINNLLDDHKRELDGITDKNDKFEKILTIGGIVAAKAAGVKEGDLKGILGIEENSSTDENKETANTPAPDINFEETKEYTGKKAESKKAIDDINRMLMNILDANNEEDAFKIIASFYNIVGFGNSNINNLTMLNDIVLSNYNKKEKSVADTIIEKANNYSNQKED